MIRKRILSFLIDVMILGLLPLIFEFINDVLLSDFVPEIIFVSAWLIFFFGYFTVQLTLFSRTIGMRIMKLKAVRTDGTPLTGWDAIVRFCFGFLDIAAFGGLLALFFNKKQREKHS